MDEKRKNYVIAIGIDRYEHPDLENFDCCERDCQTIIRILSKDYGFETIGQTFSEEFPEGKEQENVLFNSAATVENIRNLFKNLRNHPEFKEESPGPATKAAPPAPNLVIYFSGHGLVSTPAKKSLFYWVPHTYKGSLQNIDNTGLYSILNELIPDLDYIRVHNLLLVSDSCHSAAVFQQIKFFEEETNEPEGVSREDQRSAWGLCSSASNQLSKAGRKLSLFTSHLADVLEENTNEMLSFSQLYGRLDEKMKDAEQRTFYRRLRSIPDNTGEFKLAATAVKLEKSMSQLLAEYLRPGIQVSLNYSEERKNIRKLRRPESHMCVIISGTQDHAPKLLLKIILSDEGFEYDKNTPLINPLDGYSGPDVKDMVLNLFRLAGVADCATEAQLVKELTKKLNISNQLIKIVFPEEIIERVELIGELVRITDLVREQKTSRNLVILILDEENTQYQNLLSEQGPIKFIFMDKIGAVSRDDFDDWYSAQRQLLKQVELATFLEQRVRRNSDSIVGTGDHLPRIVIEKICECAGCPEIVYSILSI